MKKIAIVVVSLLCVVTLVACSSKGKGTFSSEIDPDAGAYKVIADDAGKGASVASLGGGMDIEQGQVLAVSPNLTEGAVEVRLLDSEGNVAFDQEVSGEVFQTHEMTPGTYSVGATCNADGTTGTVLIFTESADDLKAQNEALENAADEAAAANARIA